MRPAGSLFAAAATLCVCTQTNQQPGRALSLYFILALFSSVRALISTQSRSLISPAFIIAGNFAPPSSSSPTHENPTSRRDGGLTTRTTHARAEQETEAACLRFRRTQSLCGMCPQVKTTLHPPFLNTREEWKLVSLFLGKRQKRT